nr:hypothetical protein [Tanacetum cinerariifolium]
LDAPLVKDRVSDNKDCSVESPVVVEKKTIVPTIAKVEVVRPKQQEKLVRKTVKNMVPRVVFIKTGPQPLNIVRLVNTAHPKTTVHSARSMSCFSKIAPSTVRRPIEKKTSLTNRSFHQKVNTAKGKVNTARPKAVHTARPKAVNTARPSPTVVNAIRAN